MPRIQSAQDRLAAELANVAGQRCGHSCEHHVHGDAQTAAPLVCQRGPGHADARILADVHLATMPDGSLVTFGDECCTVTQIDA